MGAIGGPCSGHLEVSHVTLIEASAVEQVNSSPWLLQTSAESPGKKVCPVSWEASKDQSQTFSTIHSARLDEGRLKDEQLQIQLF